MIYELGNNNSIEADFDYTLLKELKITILGSGNRLIFHSKPLIKNASLVIYLNCQNSTVILGSHIICNKNVFISMLPAGKGELSHDLHCEIESGVIFNGSVSLTMSESNNSIFIGGDSLFADSISLTTSDSHKIFDLESGARLNPAKDIYVGRRVWIGTGVRLLKGTHVSDDSVCAAGSIINDKFNSANVILAGILMYAEKNGQKYLVN